MTTQTPHPLNFEHWAEKYRPVSNLLREDAPFDGRLFEQYFEEVKTVCEWVQRWPSNVWTLIEVDGREYIVSGWHHVNRMGYFLTNEPFAGHDAGEVLEIPVLSDEESEVQA